MNDTIDKAIEAGVTPDQFREAYERRQSTATSRTGSSRTIEHSLRVSGAVVITIGCECIHLSPKTAIRWGESLAAAGRECK